MSIFQYCSKRLFSLKQDLQTTLPTMLFDLLAYARQLLARKSSERRYDDGRYPMYERFVYMSPLPLVGALS